MQDWERIDQMSAELDEYKEKTVRLEKNLEAFQENFQKLRLTVRGLEKIITGEEDVVLGDPPKQPTLFDHEDDEDNDEVSRTKN